MKYVSILIIVVILAQRTEPKTGVIHYGEIQSLGLGSPVGQDYSALMVFDKDRSLYVTRKDSLDPNLVKGTNDYNTINSRASFSVSTNPEGFQYYNDLKNKSLYSRDIGFNYVKDTLVKINWKITNKEKKIGNFNCTKATCHYSGRDYTAWFAKELPMPFGPWKLQGLPGIILEAYDTNKEIYWYFKEMEYPSKFNYLLKSIDSGTKPWIEFAQYKKKLIAYHKKAVIAGRMAGEKLNIEVIESPMSNTYIEAFDAIEE